MTTCKLCNQETCITCLCGFCHDCINKYGHDECHDKLKLKLNEEKILKGVNK